jgi:hypothetical protein
MNTIDAAIVAAWLQAPLTGEGTQEEKRLHYEAFLIAHRKAEIEQFSFREDMPEMKMHPNWIAQ